MRAILQSLAEPDACGAEAWAAVCHHDIEVTQEEIGRADQEVARAFRYRALLVLRIGRRPGAKIEQAIAARQQDDCGRGAAGRPLQPHGRRVDDEVRVDGDGFGARAAAPIMVIVIRQRNGRPEHDSARGCEGDDVLPSLRPSRDQCIDMFLSSNIMDRIFKPPFSLIGALTQARQSRQSLFCLTKNQFCTGRCGRRAVGRRAKGSLWSCSLEVTAIGAQSSDRNNSLTGSSSKRKQGMSGGQR